MFSDGPETRSFRADIGPCDGNAMGKGDKGRKGPVNGQSWAQIEIGYLRSRVRGVSIHPRLPYAYESGDERGKN